MKTKEELIALKAEYELLNRKLGELTDDEMEQVTRLHAKIVGAEK